MNKLIILHGWGHNKNFWDEFVGQFTEYDAEVVELPGFGSESLIDTSWGIPEYAGWVQNEIQKRKLDRVILLGHSFGGRISSYIASSNPSWLKGLILYASPSIYRPSKKVRLKILLAKLRNRLGIKLKHNNQELMDADEAGLGQIFRNVVNFDQTSLLSQIDIHTLLIWGENDEEVPIKIAEEMNNLMPNSELIILEKLGHNVHMENPNIFYGTIKRFLQKLN